MEYTTVLLLSREQSLSESIRKAVDSVSCVDLTVDEGFQESRRWITDARIAVVLLHLTDDESAALGSELLRRLRNAGRSVSLLAIGEPGQARNGLQLLRSGAVDYLERPLDLRRLAYLLDNLTVNSRYTSPPLQPASGEVEHLGEIEEFYFDRSAALGRIVEQVRRVSAVSTSILLQGETGTGKTRLARIIHDLSPRRGERFLDVNCGALSSTLIESEMFGHVKGAFTGADRDRTGKFAEVGGGTLFLDEIDSMPLELQAKLLRVIENRVFEPVGSNRTVPLRARIIAASNRPLNREVAEGRFRSDLFYRLNVVMFHIPPLREQAEIIPALIDRFISQFAGEAGRDIRGVEPNARRALLSHTWPGNVRELRNAIERAIALRPGGLIGLDDLPDSIRTTDRGDSPTVHLMCSPESPTLAQTRFAIEASAITAALRRHNDNKSLAAEDLGISRVTLYKKLHRYGLM